MDFEPATGNLHNDLSRICLESYCERKSNEVLIAVKSDFNQLSVCQSIQNRR